MTDLLSRFGFVIFAILAVVGLLVMVAQARFEYRKRKAFKEEDRVMRDGSVQPPTPWERG